MTDKEILEFKKKIADFSAVDLNKLKGDLTDELSQMIMNSDAVLKMAIIDAALKDKTTKED